MSAEGAVSIHRRGAEIAEKTDIEIRLAEGERIALDVPRLRALMAASIGFIAQAVSQVNVTIVGDERMRTLHGTHKGDDTTTDVLTFDMTEEGGGIEADIVICADEARRRAAELGHPVEHELLLYIVHGLLHCCGYDDRSEAEAARMHAEEDRILSAIGIGPVYTRVRTDGDQST